MRTDPRVIPHCDRDLVGVGAVIAESVLANCRWLAAEARRTAKTRQTAAKLGRLYEKHGQCRAMTRAGTQCKSPCEERSMTCEAHAPSAPPPKPPPPTRKQERAQRAANHTLAMLNAVRGHCVVANGRVRTNPRLRMFSELHMRDNRIVVGLAALITRDMPPPNVLSPHVRVQVVPTPLRLERVMPCAVSSVRGLSKAARKDAVRRWAAGADAAVEEMAVEAVTMDTGHDFPGRLNGGGGR